MKKILLVLCVLISLASEAQTNSRIYRFYFDNQNSVNRQFPTLVHVPKAYERDSTTLAKYAVFFFFHGAGQGYTDAVAIDGRNLSRIYNNTGQAGGPSYFVERSWPDSFRVGGTGSWQGVFIVSAQAPAWSANGDQANYIIKNTLLKFPSIDPNRIYATGLSAGGEATINFVAHTNGNNGGANTQFTMFNKAAAMLPMSQANAANSWKAGVAVTDSVPAWGFGSPLNDNHGSATRDQIAFMNAIKSNYARFTTYTTGHGDWDQFYNPTYHETIGGQSMNIYEWALQYSRAVITNPTVDLPTSATITLPLDSITITPTSVTLGTGATSGTYAWTKTSGPGTPTIVTPTGTTTKIRGLLAGSYVYRLTVTNNSAQTGFDEIAITVADVGPTVTVNSTTINLPTSTTALTSTPVTNYSITSRAWYPLKKPSQPAYRVTVAGSSTALGSGLSNSANSFVNRYATWLTANGLGNVTNNAVAGTSVFDINITGLFAANPDAVLIAAFSNGYTAGEGKTITQIAQRYQQIADSCAARGKLFFTFGTLPRDEYGSSDRTRLKTINDTLAARFGARFIDGYTPLVTAADNSIKPQFVIPGDLIHVNDAGHTQLYELLRAEGLFKSLVTGPVVATPTTQNSTISNLTTSGTYLFQHSITDSRGYAATGVSTVTVVPGSNVPPVARAGNDTTITLPATIAVLSGTTSTDADGTIATYRWTRLSGSNAYNFTDSTKVTTNIFGLSANGPSPVVYTFRLTVTDNLGLTSTDDKQVTVNPPVIPLTRHIIKVGPTEYACYHLMEDGQVWRYFFNSATGKVEFLPFDMSGKLVTDVAVGFNRALLIDQDRYAYVSASGDNTPTKYTIDTLGNQFNDNLNIYGYFYTYLTKRADSSLWYWGGDDYNLFAGTNQIVRPIKLSQGTAKYRDVHMGRYIYGLTTAGDIDRWSKSGSTSPTRLTLPGGLKAKKVVGSHNDFSIAIDVNGVPYAIGNDYQYWGGSAVAASFVNVKALWNNPLPIVEIEANQNTIAFIDSTGKLFTMGDNFNGEIGNGEEWSNKKELNTFGWYNWSWGKGQLGYTPITFVPHPLGKRWAKLFNSNVYNFYWWAIDEDGDAYFWGRNKSFVGGDGIQVNPENTYPNSRDILQPQIRRPWLATPATSYTFVPGTLNAGATVFTSDTVVTLSATGTPSTGYSWQARNWTITGVTGDSLANANIESPTAQTTRITGLTKGAYQFTVQFIDNNNATISDTVSIIVSAPPVVNVPPVANAGTDSTITLPRNTVTLIGSGYDPDGEIRSFQWTKVSGGAATIISDASPTTPVINLVAGPYVFRFTARDTSGAATFDDVSVTVNNGGNPLPAVSIGIPSVVVLPTSSVTLVGSAVASGGTITGIQWTNTVRPPGASAPTIAVQAATTVINDLSTPGLYTFRLQATDSNGGVSAATVNVTVNLPGNACPPQIIQFNNNIKIRF